MLPYLPYSNNLEKNLHLSNGILLAVAVVPTLVIFLVMEVVVVEANLVIHLFLYLIEGDMVLVGVVHLIPAIQNLKGWEVQQKITPEPVEVEVVQECHLDLVGLEDLDWFLLHTKQHKNYGINYY